MSTLHHSKFRSSQELYPEFHPARVLFHQHIKLGCQRFTTIFDQVQSALHGERSALKQKPRYAFRALFSTL